MKETFIAITIAVVSSYLTNYIQHHFSEQSERRKEALNLLNEYYAQIFTCYTNFLETHSPTVKGKLLASIEKARIVAPDSTEKLLNDFEIKVLKNNPDSELAPYISNLRKAFREDIQQILKRQ